jgi:hypothetical protein
MQPLIITIWNLVMLNSSSCLKHYNYLLTQIDTCESTSAIHWTLDHGTKRKHQPLNHVFEIQISLWMPGYLLTQKIRMMTFLSITRPTFTIEWPVCFMWWYRGILRQFDNGKHFRRWMGIWLASRIHTRNHFVGIARQWNWLWR